MLIFLFSYVADVVVQWCSQGDLLAVAGMERTVFLSPDTPCSPPTKNAIVKFYNVQGDHIYTLDTPAQVRTWSCYTGAELGRSQSSWFG